MNSFIVEMVSAFASRKRRLDVSLPNNTPPNVSGDKLPNNTPNVSRAKPRIRDNQVESTGKIPKIDNATNVVKPKMPPAVDPRMKKMASAKPVQSTRKIPKIYNTTNVVKPNMPPVDHQIKKLSMSQPRSIRDDPTTSWVEHQVERQKPRKTMMSSEQVLAQFGLTESSFDHCYGPKIPVVDYPDVPRTATGAIQKGYVAVGRFCEDGKNWMTLMAKVDPEQSKKSP